MITVPVTPEMLALATARAASLGQLRNSIESGGGNLAGYLGELLIESQFDTVRVDDYDHDLVVAGRRVDVKTKRQASTQPPPLYYEASVACFNLRQDCDEYWFCRVSNCYTVGWVCGWLTKAEFRERAVHHVAGSVDPSNNFTFKADCYNVRYSDLNEVRSGDE